MRTLLRIFVASSLALPLLAAAARAQDAAPAGGSSEALARQLANPVSSLISLPLQSNYDCCAVGDDDGRFTVNVQPVIPLRLSDDLNLIVRTIVPFIDQGAYGSGLGDTTQSFFFSPPSRNGLTWAAGPVVYYPTGTDGFSGRKWGAGPTGLVLKQSGRVTFGVLANHIWSVAGPDTRGDISSTFLQPFFNYTFPDSTGVVVNLESSYDWETEALVIPLNAGVTHLYDIAGQRIQLGLMGRVYLNRPAGGPDWGLRFVTTFLFPE